MFPWSSEFVWDAGHLAFFGAFYSVLAAVVVVLLLSLLRARADARAGRVEAIAWHGAFEALPAADRACRHQITGEAPGRACENGFDCRGCAEHRHFAALRDPLAEPVAGALPLDRLYHRGHAFVKAEADGRLGVGLDEMARRLLGAAHVVGAPAPGERVAVGGPLLQLQSRGHDIRIVSPVDGIVTSLEGDGTDVVVHVRPAAGFETSHLLSGGEAQAWALRELERLQALVGPSGLGAALADGGELVADVGAAIPPERLGAVLGEMFLDL